MTIIDPSRPAPSECTSNSDRATAETIVKRMSYWSAGAGFLPIPALDLAAIMAVQVKMVRDIAAVYGVPFNAVRVKAIVAAVVGGTLPVGAGLGLGSVFGSSTKTIPVIGTLIGAVTVPATALAMSQAVGKLFIEHFETGGTLLDFDAEKMRSHFQAETPTPAPTI